MLDLAIVGAGPCGLACAAAAHRAGLDYAVFDKGNVCHAISRFPVGLRFFSTSERLSIAGIPFITLEAHPSREQILAYYRQVTATLGLRVRAYTEVTGLEREGEGFRLRLRDARVGGRPAQLRARAVAVATGYFDSPNRLDVPGEDLPHVSHYFREAHPYFGQRVLVVGGRNSAVEAAIELARAGAAVTLVHRGPELSEGVKPWILPFFHSLRRRGLIETVFRATVRRIDPGTVNVAVAGDQQAPPVERVIPADFVFLLTGFRPDHAWLRALGARIDPATGAPVHDPETMQTDVPGLYVVGVAAAGHDANKIFIENGRFHGPRVVRHLLRLRGLDEEEIQRRLQVPLPPGGRIGEDGAAEVFGWSSP